MSTGKSERELAFLHDLYVAPDWGERFAELIDEHVSLPKTGSALYVAAGTGGHALALQERAGQDFTLVCVDESGERVALAQAKAKAVKTLAQVDFRTSQLEALAFEDDAFDLVVGDASMIASERLPEILAEMVRVAAPAGRVALNVTTASSFGEFFSVYWEALSNVGFEEHAPGVEMFIKELPTVSHVESLAARESLDEIESWTQKEEFNFTSGEEFINSPLVRYFLVERWLEPLPDDEARERVLNEVARIIDEERLDGEFTLSVKATIVAGRKAE